MVSKRPAAYRCFTSKCGKFMIVLPSGIAALTVSWANSRIEGISYNDSSIAESLSENMFCSK